MANIFSTINAYECSKINFNFIIYLKTFNNQFILIFKYHLIKTVTIKFINLILILFITHILSMKFYIFFSISSAALH